MYISEKKMHQSSFEASQRKKSYLWGKTNLPIKKVSLQKTKPSKINLPDLKNLYKKL